MAEFHMLQALLAFFLKNEKSYKKRNPVRFITQKEQQKIQNFDLVWIKITSLDLDEFKNLQIINFKRKISNITFFEKTFLYFFRMRFAIFSW